MVDPTSRGTLCSEAVGDESGSQHDHVHHHGQRGMPCPPPCPPLTSAQRVHPVGSSRQREGHSREATPDLFCRSDGNSLGDPLASALGTHARSLLRPTALVPTDASQIFEDYAATTFGLAPNQVSGDPFCTLRSLDSGNCVQPHIGNNSNTLDPHTSGHGGGYGRSCWEPLSSPTASEHGVPRNVGSTKTLLTWNCQGSGGSLRSNKMVRHIRMTNRQRAWAPAAILHRAVLCP